jgi:hypothetical protein
MTHAPARLIQRAAIRASHAAQWFNAKQAARGASQR